jgi:hypothetical protein
MSLIKRIKLAAILVKIGTILFAVILITRSRKRWFHTMNKGLKKLDKNGIKEYLK